MTDERDDVVDVQALEPIAPSALDGPAVDGVTALAELSDTEFEEKLAALVKGRDRIQKIKRTLMVEDVHYGVIPGTPKPTLYQPGAQLLCMIFSLRATFEQEVDYYDGKTAPAVRCRTTCSLHLGDTSGPIIATGNGAASTWERKHRYRRGDRACPECGVIGSIIRGKAEYGGGFVCWKKKDGCGIKFEKTDQRIIGQQVGDVENEDQHDLENTIIKMAEKRSYVGAVLRGTASSDLFQQDIESGDGPGDDGGRPGPEEGSHHEPIDQPRAEGQPVGAPEPGAGGVEISALNEANALFGNGGPITTSQVGRLRNLAGKAGYDIGMIDDLLAQKLSIKIEDIPALGDGYESIVSWFQRNAPAA